MRRMQLKKEGMTCYSHEVCPRVIAKLEVSKLDARNCIIEWVVTKPLRLDIMTVAKM